MRYTILFIIVLTFTSCVENNKITVEPHLELGQEITFPGSLPDKSYVIVGYRRNFEGPVEKDYNNQDYLVFVYFNDHNEFKEGTIHKIALLKR